jgi:hypothetical protein
MRRLLYYHSLTADLRPECASQEDRNSETII